MNTVIHRAVRRDLDRFVSALTDFPAGDTDRAAGLARAWAHFDGQLTDHHEGEHRIAWPALQAVGVTPELMTTLDAEHEAMAAAMSEARRAIADLARTASAEDAAAARAAFTTLRSVTIAHLDHEEAELESIYLQQHDRPELQAMVAAFRKDSGPPKAGQMFAWLLDGADDAERAALRALVPGPVVTIFSTLFGRRYRKTVAPVWSAA